MLINSIIQRFQAILCPIVESSRILKFVDNIIFLSICATLLTSVFAPSDTIGYFAIIGIFLTIVKILTSKGFKFEYSKFEFWLILYLCFVIVSVAGSSLFALSLKGFLKTLIYLGYYVCCTVYLKDHKADILKLFAVLGLCISTETIVGFLQNSSHVSALAGWQDTSALNPEQVMTRVYGTLKPLNPNLFGGYLLAGVPVLYGTVALLARRKNYPFMAAGVVLALLATLVLFMSGCRGVYIAFPLMLIVPAWVLLKKCSEQIKSLLYKIYAGIFACGCFVVLASTSLRARVLSIFALRGDSSTSFRLNVYQSSLQMFRDNPFLGIGVGNQNFRETYGLYMKTGYDALSAYNIYLETAVESGIFALIAFVGFLFYVIKSAFSTIFSTKNIDKAIILTVALTSIVGVLCHGFVDTIFYRPQLQFVFWLMIAVVRTLAK